MQTIVRTEEEGAGTAIRAPMRDCDHIAFNEPLFIAATHTVRSDAKSGIQTVVRSLIPTLSEASAQCRIVSWNANEKRLLLYEAGSSKDCVPVKILPGSWLLIPEVIYGRREQRIIRYARRRHMRIIAIFHDAIPVTHPNLVRREARKYHAGYMKALSKVDLLIAVSESAASQFRLFAQKHRLRIPPLHICAWPGELLNTDRAAAKSAVSPDGIHILCASTLEPRKNHAALIEAFQLAAAAVIEPKLYLHLVGDRHCDAEYIAQNIQAAAARNPNLKWHGKVTDEELSKLYEQCDFTIYPSVVEGFGIPIAQSLWNRRPCICANFGAMAETAGGGGCLTVDVRNIGKIAEAITALATGSDLRNELVKQIEGRPIRTWRHYGVEFCNLLARLENDQLHAGLR